MREFVTRGADIAPLEPAQLYERPFGETVWSFMYRRKESLLDALENIPVPTTQEQIERAQKLTEKLSGDLQDEVLGPEIGFDVIDGLLLTGKITQGQFLHLQEACVGDGIPPAPGDFIAQYGSISAPTEYAA